MRFYWVLHQYYETLSVLTTFKGTLLEIIDYSHFKEYHKIILAFKRKWKKEGKDLKFEREIRKNEVYRTFRKQKENLEKIRSAELANF